MIQPVKIGRLAFRVEGEFWNAYYALTTSMEGALLLGSIRVGVVPEGSEVRRLFMLAMRTVVGDIIEEKTGTRPLWGGETPAPESERSGNA